MPNANRLRREIVSFDGPPTGLGENAPARAAGKRDKKAGRARQLLARTPDLVRGYCAPRYSGRSPRWRTRERWKPVEVQYAEWLRMGESRSREIPRTQRSRDRCIRRGRGSTY